jgi:hypothetical protein
MFQILVVALNNMSTLFHVDGSGHGLFKYAIPKSPLGTEEKHDKPQSAITRMRFELDPSLNKCYSTDATPT